MIVGLILDLFGGPDGRRWVFRVNLLSGLLALVLTWSSCRPPRRQVRHSTDIDLPASCCSG